MRCQWHLIFVAKIQRWDSNKGDYKFSPENAVIDRGLKGSKAAGGNRTCFYRQ